MHLQCTTTNETMCLIVGNDFGKNVLLYIIQLKDYCAKQILALFMTHDNKFVFVMQVI